VRKVFWGWVAWFLFLFVLDFTIPFLGLKDVPKVTGSFLFWILWILVAIGAPDFRLPMNNKRPIKSI